MCNSLTYEHDECKVTLQDQLAHNEKLLLRIRELEESLQGKEKDMSFSQSAVRAVLIVVLLQSSASTTSTHRFTNGHHCSVYSTGNKFKS